MAFKLAKLSHSNPLIVLSVSTKRIIFYKNMIEHCVGAYKYHSKIAFDIIPFLLLSELADANETNKEKIKDGTSISPWLENIAEFLGQFFKT